MFEALSERLTGALGGLRGRGRIRAADLDETLAEIRLALLSADVSLGVVDRFVQRVRERGLGAEVMTSLTPGHQVAKIVKDELVAVLGGNPLEMRFATTPPTVLLLAGLQGAGKTTAAAKLAQWCKSQGRNPLLVGADLARPAAPEQLRTLAADIDVDVWSQPGDPVACASGALAQARRVGRDVLVVDTAGRLAVDSEMMTEIARISDAVEPHYTFLVVDAMMGQDAVATAAAFHATLEIDGVILTKLDGDARGGAALSVSETIGRPVAFASVGEKTDEFELFRPDRLAGRILGEGDIATLIDKAERVYEQESVQDAARRLADGSFTLDDFVGQLRQIRKMGSLRSIAQMMPGISDQLRDVEIDDNRIGAIEAIVLSMTPAERVTPAIIDASRRARIAAGSGTSSAQVASLLKQFAQMYKTAESIMGPGSQRRRAGAGRKRRKGTARAADAAGSRTGGGRAGSRSARPTRLPAGLTGSEALDELLAADPLDLKLPGR